MEEPVRTLAAVVMKHA